jgi:hypothetical protein
MVAVAMTCRTCQQIRDVMWRVARFMPSPKDSNLRAWRQTELQRRQQLKQPKAKPDGNRKRGGSS